MISVGINRGWAVVTMELSAFIPPLPATLTPMIDYERGTILAV